MPVVGDGDGWPEMTTHDRISYGSSKTLVISTRGHNLEGVFLTLGELCLDFRNMKLFGIH